MGMGEEAEIAGRSDLGRKFSKIGNSKKLFPLFEIEVQSCLYGPWVSRVSPPPFGFTPHTRNSRALSKKLRS